MNIEHRTPNYGERKQLRNSLINIRNWLFLLVITTSGCSGPYKHLTKTELTPTAIKEVPYSLPYSEKTFIFKTDISFYKNDISGLLIIKKTDKKVYRIALTTQFGLKIFDFELNNGILKIEYCVEYLNKKMILNTFQNDFSLLLMQYDFNQIFSIENPAQNQKIWQIKSGILNYNYIQNMESGNIENISFKKRNSEKISVGLYSYKGNIPWNISLEHRNIKLKMNLKLIQ